MTGFENDLPEFASISDIVVLPTEDVMFYVQKYETIGYSEHFHSFEVRKEVLPQSYFIRQCDTETYLPSHAVKPFGCAGSGMASQYIAPRYMVPYQ